MPPRFAYWTILIDGKATAFRARDPQELLPTLTQLKRTNTDVLMRWFARGHLWESPEAERAAARKPKPPETRGRDWRPGGQHQDPRARFKKRSVDRDRGGHRERPAASRPPSFGKRPPLNARRTLNTPPAGEPPHGGRPPIQRPQGPPPRQDRPQFAREAARRPPSGWREKDRPRKPHAPGSPPASRAPSKQRDPRKRR